MSVDGIGKPGPGRPGGLGDVEPAAGPSGPDADISLRETEAVETAHGSEALARLERGEMKLDAYLEARVGDAVRHLEGKLPPAELDFVRGALREQLETDPVLIELVRRATGATPSDAGSG